MGTISLDTRKAHLVRPHGDLVAIFTWMDDERCVVLVPAHRSGAPWFVVKESASFSWDDEDPKNVANVVRKSTTACNVLGIEPTPHNCRRIAGIIIDGLPDLIRMPSAPQKEQYRGSYGHMIMSADGKAFAHEEIKIDKEGVQYGTA